MTFENNRSLRKYFAIGILIFAVGLIFLTLILPNDKPDFNKGRFLKGKKFRAQDSFGKPFGILYLAGRLIIYDDSPISDENQVRIYDVNSFKLLSSFGKHGSGPGEYRGLWAIDRSPKYENKITLHDVSLLRYSVIEISNPNKVKIDTMITLKEGDPYCPVFVNDSIIISPGGTLKEGRFAAYDLLGNIKGFYGEPLPGKDLKTPMPIHQQASIGRLKVTPDGSKYIISAQYSDLIDVYNNNGVLLKRISGPLNMYPKYNVKTYNNYPRLSHDKKDAITGYMDIALTNDKIIALYSGIPLEQNEFDCKFLHVFSMKGELLETVILDHKLVRITLDAKNNRLYGIQFSPIPEIYMYQL